MARLLDWIPGLSIIGRSPLTGPRTIGGGSTESLEGYVQTVSSPFGLWRWQFSLRPMRKALFRRYRGLVTALHGGANAVRVTFCDPDGMTWEESGVTATSEEIRAGLPWSNGASFSNGENWSVGRPWEDVSVAAAKGDTTISISGNHWGHNVLGGEQIGFVPLHLGMYVVTEIVERGDALSSPSTPTQIRIWPPLRKALKTTDHVTLTPVMAMRLESEAAATATRGSRLAEGNTMTLIEVDDETVRARFAD